MRRMRQALSMAVLSVCALTQYGSQMPSVRMSAASPVVPLTPHVAPCCSGSACFVRSSVSRRMTLAPQFCASVRGMTSRALPMAAYGHLEMPSTSLAERARACAMASSVAPPPGSIRGSNTTLRTT